MAGLLSVPMAQPAAAAHDATSVAVPYIVQGQTRTITVEGTGFSDLPTLAVEISPATGITVLDTTFVDATTVTAEIATTGSAALGPHDVTVVEVPGIDEDTCADCLSITRAGGISPLAVNNAAAAVITVTGTGFDGGVTGVQLLSPGLEAIAATEVEVVNDTTLTATLPLVGAAPVRYVVRVDLTVGGPLEYGDTVSGGLAVTAAGAPTVSAANPATLGQGVANRTVRLTGTNLAKGATVTTDNPGITVGATTWVSTTAYDVVLSVGASAATGGVDLTLTNANGQAAVCADCLTITAKPTVTASTPDRGGQGASRNVIIDGTGFESTITPSGLVVSGTGVSVSNLTRLSATQLSATLTIAADAVTGARNLTVTNPDGGSGSCGSCFTVTAAPVVSSITPSAADNTETALAVTINGSGFNNTGGGLTATLVREGQDDIAITGLGVAPTQITGTVDVSLAAPGGWSVRVVNADGGTGTCTDCLAISGSTPTVVSVAPSQVARGASGVDLTITGTNFAHGDTVVFGTGVTADGPPIVVDSTHITVEVTVAAGAPLGATTVHVDHPGGQTGTACGSCLSINAAPTLAASPANPASRGQGAASQTVVITGTGFQSGATVAFSGTGVTVAGTPVVGGGGTTLTASVTVAPTATIGARDLTVTNPDAGSATAVGAFTVTAGPTIATVTPSSRARSTSGAVIVVGSEFHSGITASDVSFSGTGVNVTSVVRDSSTQLTLQVTVTSGAATGARSLTVRNPDDMGTTTKAPALTVTAGATVTSVSPNNGIQGTAFTVTINGSGFAPGSTVTFSSPGIDSGPVTFVSSSRLDVPVEIEPGANPGAGQVTVSSPGSGPASSAFTVVAANQVQRFVTAAYLDTLVRLPDRAGFDFFVARIQAGAQRSTVADSLLRSNEARRRFITILFHRYLERAPDEGGLQYYADQLLTRTIEAISVELTGSDEYFNARAGGNLDAFVTVVYNDVLGRNPDPGGFAFWRSQLAAGRPRFAVAGSIILSDEAVFGFVDLVYQLILGREADDAGLVYWSRLIQGGERNEKFIALLIGSDEYLAHV